MKDKVMMMYDHIRSSVDVDPWAIEELRRVLDAYMSNGCFGCAFEDREEWEMPCLMCSRNCKNYWRAKNERSDKQAGGD